MDQPLPPESPVDAPGGRPRWSWEESEESDEEPEWPSRWQEPVLVPSRDAWSDGERDIVCGLYHPDEDLRGTSKGSRR